MRKVWKKRGGFTLIELLIVVAIIGILAGIAIPSFVGTRSKARVSRVFADFRTIGEALETYAVGNIGYPSEDDWVDELTLTYITSIADDPFNPGNTYRYYTDAAAGDAGGAWLIVSDGPDGDADVAEPNLSWVDADRIPGQLGGPDGEDAGYGSNDWHDPDAGATSNGDLGRGGP